MNKLTKKQVLEKEALFILLELYSADEKNFDVVKYNEAIQNLNSFIFEIREEMQMYFDDKSEKWQESDKGFAYQEWIENWEVEFEEIENFDEIELPVEAELSDEP
jgi:hypothetical protein